MNNLRKFQTEAQYSAATLNYPAVSWVVEGDGIHFDKASQVNDKLMFCFNSGTDGALNIVAWNCGASELDGVITSVTVNDDAVSESVCPIEYTVEDHTDYIVKMGINGTAIGEWFSGDLGIPSASSPLDLDVLIPSKVTEVGSLPNNQIDALIFESATPPTLNINWSAVNVTAIYVPTNAVSTYDNDPQFSQKQGSIYSISEYEGILPV